MQYRKREVNRTESTPKDAEAEESEEAGAVYPGSHHYDGISNEHGSIQGSRRKRSGKSDSFS